MLNYANPDEAKLRIKIDGRLVTVWRYVPRQKPTGLRVEKHYSQPGMHGGRFVPMRFGPAGTVLLATGWQTCWELWTQSEKFEIRPAEPIDAQEIDAIDWKAQIITLKTGSVLQAGVTRQPLSDDEFKVVQHERMIAAMSDGTTPGGHPERGQPGGNLCAACGLRHDPSLCQIILPSGQTITLAGVLPDIVRCIHRAHEKGFACLSTKDEELLKTCGGYGHPCKAFDDLGKSAAYKALFDTSRRGFVAFRSPPRKQSE